MQRIYSDVLPSSPNTKSEEETLFKNFLYAQSVDQEKAALLAWVYHLTDYFTNPPKARKRNWDAIVIFLQSIKPIVADCEYSYDPNRQKGRKYYAHPKGKPNEEIDLESTAAIAQYLKANHMEVLIVSHPVFDINGWKPIPNLVTNSMFINGEARPISTAADLHGGFCPEGLSIFSDVLDAGNRRALLLGDHVDRGGYSLETILMIIALMLKYPSYMLSIIGNHEFPNSIYYNTVNYQNAWLPIEATLRNTVIGLLIRILSKFPVTFTVLNKKCVITGTHGAFSPHQVNEILQKTLDASALACIMGAGLAIDPTEPQWQSVIKVGDESFFTHDEGIYKVKIGNTFREHSPAWNDLRLLNRPSITSCMSTSSNSNESNDDTKPTSSYEGFLQLKPQSASAFTQSTSDSLTPNFERGNLPPGMTPGSGTIEMVRQTLRMSNSNNCEVICMFGHRHLTVLPANFGDFIEAKSDNSYYNVKSSNVVTPNGSVIISTSIAHAGVNEERCSATNGITFGHIETNGKLHLLTIHDGYHIKALSDSTFNASCRAGAIKSIKQVYDIISEAPVSATQAQVPASSSSSSSSSSAPTPSSVALKSNTSMPEQNNQATTVGVQIPKLEELPNIKIPKWVAVFYQNIKLDLIKIKMSDKGKCKLIDAVNNFIKNIQINSTFKHGIAIPLLQYFKSPYITSLARRTFGNPNESHLKDLEITDNNDLYYIRFLLDDNHTDVKVSDSSTNTAAPKAIPDTSPMPSIIAQTALASATSSTSTPSTLDQPNASALLSSSINFIPGCNAPTDISPLLLSSIGWFSNDSVNSDTSGTNQQLLIPDKKQL